MKKKGFTLIELLAVIVILAILALIVSPIISGVITNAKISAAERSMEGFATSVELAQSKYQSKNGGKITKNISDLSIEGKSITKVTNRQVTIDDAGIIEIATANIDGFTCVYKKNEGAKCTTSAIVEDSEFAYIKNSNYYDYQVYLENAGVSASCIKDKEVCTSSELNSIEHYYLYFVDEARAYFYNIEVNTDTSPITRGLEITDIIFTHYKRSGTGNDVSLNDTGDVLLYLEGTKIYIYSEKNIKAPKDSSYLFSNLIDVVTFNFNNMFDTSNVINMSHMFNNCRSMVNLDLANFNTSNVTDMSAMFYGCNSLTELESAKFNTSNVTDMSAMFRNCNSLTELDLANFNTSNVINMSYMFYYCYNLTNIYVTNLWNVGKVIDSNNMFWYSEKLPNYDWNITDKTNANTSSTGYLTLKS